MEELTLDNLSRKLRKQYITINALRNGDVIITDQGPWLVTSTNVEANGFFTVTGTGGNGFINVPGSNVCVIVDRLCFR